MATTITVKNIPSDLYNLLKQKAGFNRRSINNEIIAMMETAMRSKKINPDEFLVAARRLREKTKKIVLTETFINQAKRKGRP